MPKCLQLGSSWASSQQVKDVEFKGKKGQAHHFNLQTNFKTLALNAKDNLQNTKQTEHV